MGRRTAIAGIPTGMLAAISLSIALLPGCKQTKQAKPSPAAMAPKAAYDPTVGLGARYLGGGSWGGTSAAWSPDGKLVVFAALDRTSSDLYLARPDGSVERLTKTPFWEMLPTFDPMADSIYFVSDQDSTSGEWYFMSLKDGQIRRLAPGATVGSSGAANGTDAVLRFTSDHQSVLFVAAKGSTDHGIFICSRDGANLRRLSPEGWYAHSPVLIPGSDRVLFSARETIAPDTPKGFRETLWFIRLDGTHLERVFTELGAFLTPVGVEENRRTFYLRSTLTSFYEEARSSPQELWCVNGDGSNPKRLTQRGGTAGLYTPLFSAASRSILFTADLDHPYDYEIYRLDLRNGHLDQITQELGYVTLFCFSPDGKRALLQVDEDRDKGWGWIGVLDLDTRQIRRCRDNHLPEAK